MGLLHSERWPELGPEFEAAKLLDQAIAALSVDDAPSTAAMALQQAKVSRGLLHPCTRDPAACAEYEARKAGQFGETARVKREGDARDQTIKDLTARLAALEGKSDAPTKTEGKGAK